MTSNSHPKTSSWVIASDFTSTFSNIVFASTTQISSMRIGCYHKPLTWRCIIAINTIQKYYLLDSPEIKQKQQKLHGIMCTTWGILTLNCTKTYALTLPKTQTQTNLKTYYRPWDHKAKDKKWHPHWLSYFFTTGGLSTKNWVPTTPLFLNLEACSLLITHVSGIPTS